MEARLEEITRRPIYGMRHLPLPRASANGSLAYDIPKDVLSTLKPKEDVSSIQIKDDEDHDDESNKAAAQRISNSTNSSTSCALCAQSFATVEDQRSHVRSDLHNYNLKRRIRNAPPVSENEFETLIKDLDESLSGSDDSEEESDDDKGNMLSNLLKRQVTLKEDYTTEGRSAAVKTSGRAPLLWFETPTLPKNTYLGVYRTLFAPSSLSTTEPVELLRQKQLPLRQFPQKIEGIKPDQVGPHIFMLMIGGGHFAAMIVALSPALRKHANMTGPMAKEAVVICHKTFHRYTTRRKQGGSQSANDSKSGAAHSAGAGIRRYNEAALRDDVRALLGEWKDMIQTSELQFIRATGTENRRTLFGPYEGQVLNSGDERVRGFPFNTRRATQKELMRAFIELTRVKVKVVDEEALAKAKAAEQTAKDAAREAEAKKKELQNPVKTKEDEEEEMKELHTQQITALIKRSRLPALLQYLQSNELDANFRFFPVEAHHHAPTPLHLASSLNAPVIVTGLMAKAKADPTQLNGDGRPAYDLAGNRPTRDAFRLARWKLDESEVGTWDWEASHIPEPLSEEQVKQRSEDETAEEKRAEEARRKAETERLKLEGPKVDDKVNLGKEAQRRRLAALGAAGKTAEDKRKEEMKGLTPEMRMKLERERRARAAEERFKKMQGSGN